MSLTLNGTTNIVQSNMGTNVAGTGPAFNAYMVNGNANQSVTSGVATKVKIDTEEFDTNSNFDTSNYRFTPTVAGYYNIIGQVYGSGTSVSVTFAAIYKNGSEVSRNQITTAGVTTTASIIYMNGSTDYVELYGSVTATSPVFGYSGQLCRFSGALVRAA